MVKRRNLNTSGWMAEAEKKGLDLRFLGRDETRTAEKLERLGVPRQKVYFPSGEEIESLKTQEIFDQHPCFCRLLPKDGGDRPYKLRIDSARELRDFWRIYNPNKYQPMLLETGNTTHSGVIIATDNSPGNPGKCVLELVEGTGEDLEHGLKRPVSATIEYPGVNWFRAIRYDPDSKPTEKEKSLLLRALKMIGGISHPFPGYYAFNVYDKRKIMFYKYQEPGNSYSTI